MSFTRVDVEQLIHPNLLKPSPGWVSTLILGSITIIMINELLRERSYFAWPGRQVMAWRYLIQGTKLIQQGFEKSHGQPFELLAPDSRYVFVSSPEHIKELDAAPDNVLSLQAASKQMLQPRYTMHGFNWFDRRGTEGVGFIRALRTHLTNNLPQILPYLSLIIRARFEEIHSTHPIVNDARETPVYTTVTKLVVLSNAVSFFGMNLAKDEEFMVSALAYIEHTLICAEIVRIVPKFLAPIVGGVIARRLKAHEKIFNTLLPVAEERVRERDQAIPGRGAPRHTDCIQWILDTSPKDKPWTAKRVVHELMAIWFGSVHALSTTITFGIHDLCLHPEYVQPLRIELDGQYDGFEKTGNGLPLLDSFIKESARLSPVESMSTRRHALQSFSFSDGTRVKVGDWACTPVKAIMQDPRDYPEPLKFRGFRFVAPDLVESYAVSESVHQSKPSRLTDFDDTWHVWGTGRMCCPGRFYATAVMKVIMGQILMNYDCRLVDPDERRYFTWRSSMLPNPAVQVVFTPRLLGG